MSLTFSLVLTVVAPGGTVAHDVLVRGTADQTVGELALRLGQYVGVADAERYGIRVERTGEYLRPEAPLSGVDLLEGDFVTLLPPRSTSPRTRPAWADESS